jgi:hypothetical protein
MCLGFINFKVEQDPIKLWSAESSTARQNKKYFDENFGPFYRITQLIIVPKEDKNMAKNATYEAFDDQGTLTQYSYTLSKEILAETFELYEKINKIRAFCPKCNDGKGKKNQQSNHIGSSISLIYAVYKVNVSLLMIFAINRCILKIRIAHYNRYSNIGKITGLKFKHL